MSLQRSGSVIVGTQSYTLRLSSQKRLSLSRAGSFHGLALGLWNKSSKKILVSQRHDDADVAVVRAQNSRHGNDARMNHRRLWLAEWVLQGTYRDKNAVCVFRLAGLVCTHEVGQAPNVVDANHVNVIVEAESLDECEVDLESDIALVLLIRGQYAECNTVWITVGKTRGGQSLFS